MKKNGIYFIFFLVIFIKLFLIKFNSAETTDLEFYQHWSYVGANFGLDQIYSIIINPLLSPPNYPPVIPILLSVSAYIYKIVFGNLVFGNSGFIISLKMVPIIFDILGAFIIYKIVFDFISKKNAKWASLIYLASPANIFLSSVVGQTDSIVTFFILSSVYFLLKRRNLYSWFFFALSILSKQQAIVLLPLFVFYSFRKFEKKTINGVIVFLLTIAAILSPYILNGAVATMINKISETGRLYPILSSCAFNFWWIIVGENAYLKSDLIKNSLISPFTIGIFLFFVIYYSIIRLNLKTNFTNKKFLISIFIILFTFFIFPTQIHERYLYYSLPFLLIYSFLNVKYIKYYIALQITFFINLVYFFLSIKMPNYFTIFVAFINLIIFIIIFKDQINTKNNKH